MAQRGAGGTDGGTGSFLIGLAMMIGGGYLLLNSIVVRPNFGFGSVAFRMGGLPVTSGMILIPFMFGVGMIFYNSRNWIGWILAAGSLLALVFGVIANMTLELHRMSAFDLIVILVLLVGGLGLFLRALRSSS
jgi:predicted outer membrane lipoprotein